MTSVLGACEAALFVVVLLVDGAIGLLAASGAFGSAWERDDARTGLIQRAYIVPGWLWVAAVFVDSAQ